MDCDEVIMCKMRGTRGRVGRIEVDGIKKGADFTGKVMQQLVICNDEDAHGK